jgi:hypothetical protein
MFTITTATGKQFDSDYAVDNASIGLAFVRIIGKDKKEVEQIFKNPEELPLDCFPQYGKLDGVFNENDGAKLMLTR